MSSRQDLVASGKLVPASRFVIATATHTYCFRSRLTDMQVALGADGSMKMISRTYAVGGRERSCRQSMSQLP